jgi:hypothetical protein
MLENKNQALLYDYKINSLDIKTVEPDVFYLAPVQFDKALFLQAVVDNESLFDRSLFIHRDLRSYIEERRYDICKSYSVTAMLSTTSYRYLSITYNLPEEHILKIATKNCWAKRAAEYDRHQLQLKLQLEQDERAKIHKQKLEDYREQQEFLGRSLSADAAKIAALVSQSLDSMLANNRGLDVRDIPAILNAAAKAAEMGRNLQSSALGVDQLLTALEEYED